MKRIFLLSFFLLVCMQMAVAQSMTDEQIVNFVLTEQEKGSSEQVIASKLLRKGVTVERMRRIKQKYDAEQQQPGAVDLTGKSTVKTRSRNKMAQDETDMRRQNNNLIRSAMEDKASYGLSEKRRMLREEMGFFDIDSLLYYRNMLENSNSVFGRNIFNNELLTFEPSLNIPTPAGYVLGAGDQVIIDVWGASQTLVDAVISPDGNIVVSGVGPLYLAGRTVAQAAEYVKNALGEVYADSPTPATFPIPVQ